MSDTPNPPRPRYRGGILPEMGPINPPPGSENWRVIDLETPPSGPPRPKTPLPPNLPSPIPGLKRKRKQPPPPAAG